MVHSELYTSSENGSGNNPQNSQEEIDRKNEGSVKVSGGDASDGEVTGGEDLEESKRNLNEASGFGKTKKMKSTKRAKTKSKAQKNMLKTNMITNPNQTNSFHRKSLGQAS